MLKLNRIWDIAYMKNMPISLFALLSVWHCLWYKVIKIDTSVLSLNQTKYINLIVRPSGTRSRIMDSLLSLDLGRELSLMLGPAGVAEFGTEPRESEFLARFRWQEPEEGVVLDANLPQSLGRAMVAQLEADGRFELLELAGTQLDEEAVSFVRNFDDLWPSEPVNPEPISVDENSWWADAQHDVDIFRVLGVVKAHAIHGQLLGVLKIVKFWNKTKIRYALLNETCKTDKPKCYEKDWILISLIKFFV